MKLVNPSLVFHDKIERNLVSPEARILSVALHSLCAVMYGSQDMEKGVPGEEAMRRISAAVSKHILNLYPGGGYDSLMELVVYADSRGLSLSEDLDPNFKAVIQ